MSQDDPEHWTSKLVDIHEAAGAAWLERLPVTLAGFARRWSLELLPPFENLSYNYVAPAVMADGTQVVVKACVPNHELTREIEALRWFNGRGIVRLLDADDEQGVMVLERLLPGTLLQEVGDERQVTWAAAAVMKSLWKPAPESHTFATLSGWARGLQRLRDTFGGGTGPLPPALVARAERLFADLLAEGEPVLIHGDLHPQNILKSRRASWLAIDPKGVVGVPLYDAATLVCSLPDQGTDALWSQAFNHRLDRLVELLGLDRQALLGWSLAHCVLSGWWSYEDHGQGWEWAFSRAEQIAALLS